MNNRLAALKDLPQVLEIYNQGIEDRIATLETELKTLSYMESWFHNREERFPIVVIEDHEEIIGWGAINPYNTRCAYFGVGELSVYISRAHRGKGIGQKIIKVLERLGKEHSFHKFVLFTFPFNKLGQGLYHKMGYREVGLFKKQGMLDGKFVDVMAMEKIL